MIHAQALTKRFEGVLAVDALTLMVGEGEIFGLVGPDGAGKTTTMRLLTSIMEPTSGEGWVVGHHIVREAERVKEKIGYMSQKFGLYGDLTVMENLLFYADIYSVPRKERQQKIESLLAFSNLAPFTTRLAQDLSGGMKQKLGLICTLVHTPQVLFLDEPTNGVDPISRRDFWRILYSLVREKVTIFLSTAYLDEAERCTRLGLMHMGKLLACCPPKEMKNLIEDKILEIATNHSRRAKELLQEVFPTKEISLFGSSLHLLTQDPEKDLISVRQVLEKEAGLQYEIRTSLPTVEDVFVSILKQQDEENGRNSLQK